MLESAAKRAHIAPRACYLPLLRCQCRQRPLGRSRLAGVVQQRQRRSERSRATPTPARPPACLSRLSPAPTVSVAHNSSERVQRRGRSHLRNDVSGRIARTHHITPRASPHRETGGIGLELSRQLLAAGYGVILACRSADAAAAAAGALRRHIAVGAARDRLRPLACDLSSFESVRAAAAAVRQQLSGGALDVLCCNGKRGPACARICTPRRGCRVCPARARAQLASRRPRPALASQPTQAPARHARRPPCAQRRPFRVGWR